jgi:mRNA interferase RelE/StbE
VNEYSITFARSARKEFEALEAKIVSRIFKQIEALAKNPHPVGCRKLEGESNLCRIRVSDFRVIYSINDHERTVDIIYIRHRSEAYR